MLGDWTEYIEMLHAAKSARELRDIARITSILANAKHLTDDDEAGMFAAFDVVATEANTLAEAKRMAGYWTALVESRQREYEAAVNILSTWL